ncbi:MAG TPA: LuxR C-terminal-related transcriptional regulator [Bacillota bacterium]|nr:LuxR C-terminal-related transcriptional regulator [Bacillota bacterium]
MSGSVLGVKLHKPEVSPNLVRRSYLIKRLLTDAEGKLVLVSAMAGSGKTTLISEWLDLIQLPYEWYSLDDWDNDLQQFYTFLTAGLTKIDSEVAQGLTELLSSYQNVGDKAFLRALIMQLHQIQKPFALVLDDYHVITNKQIDHVLRTLLEHFPLQMSLVIITRKDPSFALSRFRVNHQLIEIRASDLRFGEKEVNSLFKKMSLKIPATGVERLIKKTEGWIAGLQLAGISMQNQKDIGEFIKDFPGSQHFVMEYLLEEVLSQQKQSVKEFLLQTCILDRFCDDLCDAILDLEKGQSHKILVYLLRANLFLVPLDQDGKWYRYHHLFRDLLRQLRNTSIGPEERLKNHRYHNLAAKWYSDNGYRQEAIKHFCIAENYEEAANIIECQWATMDIQLQSATWLSTAKLLPEEVIRKRPVLSMGCGWAYLDMGKAVECDHYLENALELYTAYQEDSDFKKNIVISDFEQFDLLPATIATAYGYRAALTWDMDRLFKFTNEALEKTPRELLHKRGLIAMLLGVAYWAEGDLLQAERVIRTVLSDIEKEAIGLTVNAIYIVLGELLIQQGRLVEAKKIFEITVRKVNQEEKVPLLMASLYLGLARVAFYQGNEQLSFELLDQSKEFGFSYSIIDWKYKYYSHLATLYCYEGLYDLAMDCILEGKGAYSMNPVPDWISLDSMEAMIGIKQNNQRVIQSWIKNHSFHLQEDIPYLKTFDTLLYIRYYLLQDCSQEELDRFDGIVKKLSDSAGKQNRQKNQMECWLVEALIEKRKGHADACIASLKKAIQIGKPENFVQPFRELTDQLRDVYNALIRDIEAADFIQKIIEKPAHPNNFSKQIANQALVEPLTVREFEVLNLIAAGYSNQEICNRLFLALSTVKGYNQNIFGKLQVKRRTEAITKARDLGLI